MPVLKMLRSKRLLLSIGVITLLALVFVLFKVYGFGIQDLLSFGNTSRNPKTPGASIVEANNTFALDYYTRALGNKPTNLFFSPFSISSVFAMVYEGAQGETAEEISSVLRYPQDVSQLRTDLGGYLSRVNTTAEGYEINVANAIWVQDNFPLSPDYLTLIRETYFGEVQNLDFSSQSEKSRQTINNWVEDKTRDRIIDLIPKGAITAETRMVLTNAIYFKGTWKLAFNESETKEKEFTRRDGSSVQIPLMTRADEETRFKYHEEMGIQFLEMPYDGEGIAMFVVLPEEKNLAKVVKLLTPQQISEWRAKMKETRVNVFLPRFKFDEKYFMGSDLQDMGMRLAFSNGADFSRMTSGKRELKVDEVIHQAFVEVNEQGTEAAAATAVIMVPISTTTLGGGGPRIPVFRADHPFIFFIVDSNTGLILFMGSVEDPSQ